MSVLSKIKPVLVLSVICTLICALLIVTYNLTYVDTSGVLTDDLKAGCIAADGEGEYALITDKAAAKLDGEEFGSISKIVKNKTKGTFLFETVVDGYAADGIDAVIAIDKNGAVSGISIIALGETPGLGSKINDDAFLQRFYGVKSDISIVKSEPKNENEVKCFGGKRGTGKSKKQRNLHRRGRKIFQKRAVRGDGICEAGYAPGNPERICGGDFLCAEGGCASAGNFYASLCAGRRGFWNEGQRAPV